MMQNVLRDIGGVGLYGVISICLFFLVFTLALVWAFAQRKAILDNMRMLPLHDDESTNGGKNR